MTRLLTSGFAFVFCFIPLSLVFSQPSDQLNGRVFSRLSLTAITSSPLIKPPDRRGAQMLFAQQLASLPTETLRTDAADELLSLLRADDQKKNDILIVLGEVPVPWSTSSLEQDTKFVYQLLLQTSDGRIKLLVDNALANARGLYRDGIVRFNSSILSEIIPAESRLKEMSTKFPMSRYAEKSAFYLGQYYSKRYTLNDETGVKIIGDSNKAFEDYIVRAQNKVFDGRTDYLAAGYYYRGLNAWLTGDVKDAQKWLADGQNKFGDNDRIYVYLLFVSPDRAFNKAAVIDDYLPAKATFSKTLQFLGRTAAPSWSWERSKDLTSLLRK